MGGAYWYPVVGVLLLLGMASLLLGYRAHRGSGSEQMATEPVHRPVAAVVVNPTKIDAATRELIAAVCAELGWDEPIWLETTADDPGTGQARAALDKGVDVVLACGGDGTVRAVAQVLANAATPMGLLPAGTGNLLARALGTPLDMAAAARVALTGTDRTIDVGRVRVDGDDEEHVFLVMAGSGFDAAVMANTPEELKGRVGPLAYVVSGLRAMRGRRTRVTLTFDDRAPMHRSTRSVLVGNSGTLLGGLVLMPDALLDDGLLDVVNLSPKGITGWVAVALRVITRTRRGHPRVEHWQARSIVIAAEHPQPSQIDGDPIGDAAELRMRVDAGALVVRVPDTG